MYKVLDTFAGAGGFSLGFELAGFDVIGAIEIDKWAGETFSYNHKNAKVIIGDIRFLTDEYLLDIYKNNTPNVILGGPPCQGFSICNKNAGDPSDPRNSLFKEFLRMGALFSPEIMIMENVPNILKAKTHSNELVIDIIKQELENLGYYVYYNILDAVHYGIPQARKRLFVIASSQKLINPFPIQTHYFENNNATLNNHLIHCPTLWDAISDLPDIDAREGAEEMAYDKEPTNNYQIFARTGSDKVYNHVSMKHSKRMVERFAAMSCGDSLSDVPSELRPFKRNGNGEFSSKLYDQNNRRMQPNRPCHTIAASFYANFVHPYKNRNFTAREGARIQSFPDWYVFKGKPTVVSQKLLQREGRLSEKFLCQYNQIGNAVPPLMAKAIAKNIVTEIGSKMEYVCTR